MPHITLEYSKNIESHIDMQALCEAIRMASIETGIFPIGGIRVRAIRVDFISIADGNPAHGFLDAVVKIGEGRDEATKVKAANHIYARLELETKGIFDSMTFGLSLEMREMAKSTSLKTNNIHQALV